ncbi:hypothetical protein FGO68_gene12237 [Halteria grandinella]|uniref:Uncharacterized protein n=1 Tax=Halteria grandinella TaxID=5974 RepID=A0A8J8SV02_HALGN|nr:hypothetical protein FGO68_gene12237 [Halteria grandinella]
MENLYYRQIQGHSIVTKSAAVIRTLRSNKNIKYIVITPSARNKVLPIQELDIEVTFSDDTNSQQFKKGLLCDILNQFISSGQLAYYLNLFPCLALLSPSLIIILCLFCLLPPIDDLKLYALFPLILISINHCLIQVDSDLFKGKCISIQLVHKLPLLSCEMRLLLGSGGYCG